MIQVDKTTRENLVVLDETNEGAVMPVLSLLDNELRSKYGLEFVITKDVLANNRVVKFVEIRKKQIKRTRRSKKGVLA